MATDEAGNDSSPRPEAAGQRTPSRSSEDREESPPPLAASAGDDPDTENGAYRPADPRYGLPEEDSEQHQSDLEGELVDDIYETNKIFQRVVTTADREFGRSVQLLFFSVLAAGLSIALTFIGRATLMGATPQDSTQLVANLLYPVGFIFIVLGRYQLFTENTLTPVTLVLTRLASIPRLLRIWGVVFFANILGAGTAALFLAKTGVFDPDTTRAALELGNHTMEVSWGALLSKAVIAGWLVAGMVWLVHAVRSNVERLLIVYILMYMIPSADLFHCITGSTEVLYLLFSGETTLLEYLWHFLAPVTLGNTLGGILLVALLNYAQTEEESLPDREPLSWRDWLLGTAPREPAA